MQRLEGEVAVPEYDHPTGVSLSVAKLLADFCSKYLAMPIHGQLATMGARLYRPPPDLPDLSGLRVVRPGWRLGEVRPGRLEPSHALAMALRREEVRLAFDLSADGPEVYAYLQGRPLHSPGEDGWLLVTVDGHALGWGKRVGRIVKNHYPRRLRWSQR
jgi:NOL1/NOP2/fmu family ribosome biogenesis protein